MDLGSLAARGDAGTGGESGDDAGTGSATTARTGRHRRQPGLLGPDLSGFDGRKGTFSLDGEAATAMLGAGLLAGRA